jgi:hypothetical protein
MKRWMLLVSVLLAAVAVLGAQAIVPPGTTGVRLYLWIQQTPWQWMPVDLDPPRSRSKSSTGSRV